MAGKKIIANITGTFSIVILFLIFSLMWASLAPLTESNPQAQAVLESSQEATNNLFNGWLIAEAIGGIVLLAGIIFGIIKLIIKITEEDTYRSYYY